jgi:hypothetical protein
MTNQKDFFYVDGAHHHSISLLISPLYSRTAAFSLPLKISPSHHRRPSTGAPPGLGWPPPSRTRARPPGSAPRAATRFQPSARPVGGGGGLAPTRLSVWPRRRPLAASLPAQIPRGRFRLTRALPMRTATCWACVPLRHRAAAAAPADPRADDHRLLPHAGRPQHAPRLRAAHQLPGPAPPRRLHPALGFGRARRRSRSSIISSCSSSRPLEPRANCRT